MENNVQSVASFICTEGLKGDLIVIYDFILAPAVIRIRETGEIYAGLVELDLSSSGEHWDTSFIIPCGVFDQSDGSLNKTSARICPLHDSL